jgi:hypothetical protein
MHFDSAGRNDDRWMTDRSPRTPDARAGERMILSCAFPAWMDLF